MISLKDRISIEKILDDKLDEKFDEKFKLLPSKQDFFSKMDELMTEVKAVRVSQTLHDNQHTQVTDRLDRHHTRMSKLETVNKLPIAADDKFL